LALFSRRPEGALPRPVAAPAALRLAACLAGIAGVVRAATPADADLSLAARHLQAYVRVDTSNPPGNEKAGALALKRILDEAGLPSEIHEPRPGRASLYARLRGRGARPGLLLHHHVDVIPASADSWEAPPFEGAVRNLRLVGRGTVDDKGLGIAELEAFVAAARTGPPAGDLVFLATADEETGGELGIGLLLRERPQWFAGIGDAIGEGGLVETIVDQARLFGIEIQQKGAIWLRLVASGPGGHASIPGPKEPAVRIARAVVALTAQGRPLRLEPEVERAFRARETVGRGRPLADDLRRKVASDPEGLRASLSPRDLALLTDTIALTRTGTDSVSRNSLPRSAWAEFDVRFLPGTDPAELLRWVHAKIGDPSVKVEVLLQAVPGPTSPETGVYATIRSVLAGRYPGAAIVPDVSPALSENRVLRTHGIRTWGLTPFRLNYYDMAGIHGTNERIRLDWFDEGVETMKRIVAAWASGR
jgi:acetylornithine deacetylase/succinyl-diaminopimelate desuccinylase-like protein